MSMLPTNILEVQAINPSAKEPPVNLRQLLELLQGFSSHDLIFRSDEGDIGGGYHVTELKQASINSIDCGGRTDEWTETVLQLLDGSGDTPMSIEKFVAIVRRSEVALPGLSDAPLYFEFGHGNHSLRRLKITSVDTEAQRVIISLGDDNAVCKPKAEWQKSRSGACCGSSVQQATCC